jgi:hypothetical protein
MILVGACGFELTFGKDGSSRVRSGWSKYPLTINYLLGKIHTHMSIIGTLFVWAYQPNLPVIQQYFSLTANQRTVLLVMTFQPSEQIYAPVKYDTHRYLYHELIYH